jgi:hypothetical protein
MNTDLEAPQYHNLDTFKTLTLVYGILSFAFSLFPLIYAGFGLFIGDVIESNAQGQEKMPFDPSIIFVIIGLIGVVFCLVIGILNLLCSRYIKERRQYTFIFVVSIVNCFSGILGILLGVFTLVEINKPHVKALFQQQD